MLNKIINRFPYFLSAIAFSALVSCESVVEVPIPEHSPKLALRRMISNETQDSIYYQIFPESHAFISESRGILYSDVPPAVTNATVVITDANGKVVETFQEGMVGSSFAAPGYYKPVSDFKPSPGQYYKLTASAPGFETVTGELTLPNLINGVDASFETTYNDGYNITGRLRFIIPDNGAEENFYFLQVVALDSLHRPIPFVYISEDEDETGIGNDIQGIHLSHQNSGIRPFDDKTFNGRSLNTTHDISLNLPYFGPNGPQKIRVKYLKAIVSSLTKDTFIFHKSVELYNETYENPFAEATRIQGNLKNGYGYFGGHTNSYHEIDLHQ